MNILPTRVGMVRTASTRKVSLSRSPHTRGDGPVFYQQIIGRSTSPHTRGDGPTYTLICYLFLEFSPHAWGWSEGHDGEMVGPIVLPTPVGMVRSILIGAAKRVRLEMRSLPPSIPSQQGGQKNLSARFDTQMRTQRLGEESCVFRPSSLAIEDGPDPLKLLLVIRHPDRYLHRRLVKRVSLGWRHDGGGNLARAELQVRVLLFSSVPFASPVSSRARIRPFTLDSPVGFMTFLGIHQGLVKGFYNTHLQCYTLVQQSCTLVLQIKYSSDALVSLAVHQVAQHGASFPDPWISLYPVHEHRGSRRIYAR
jgi:hypothetical protein